MKRTDIVGEISLGDYRKKAGMQKAQAGMGAMFGRSPEERARELATFKKRERGLERVKARDERARKAEIKRQQDADIAALPELRAEYEQMKARYKALGGSNWQYADREQNLTDSEREARSMEGPMNNLWRRINAAEKAQKEGVAEEVGYDEVSSKDASYILRKLDQGVPMSDILDDFPELSRMMDVIAGEHGLHPDDDFEEIEDILRNDLEDIASSDDDFGDYDQDEEEVKEMMPGQSGEITDIQPGKSVTVSAPSGKPGITTSTQVDLTKNPAALTKDDQGKLVLKLTPSQGAGAQPKAEQPPQKGTEVKFEDDTLEAVHRIQAAGPTGSDEPQSANTRSTISGDEDHDEMSKLLVSKLRKLAGLA